MSPTRHWLIVASQDHARRGVREGYVMANHGKKAPLSRMSRGDSVWIYSPKTTYPEGQPLRALTVVGEITGEEPEPSDLIRGGSRLAAHLHEIEPLPLTEIRDHLPTSRLRFGFLELDTDNFNAIASLIEKRSRAEPVDDALHHLPVVTNGDD